MDSQCVLYWMKTRKPLTVFVENRVKEIRGSSDINLQYVTSADNPADIASRGTTTETLKNSIRWWDGPYWLTENKSQWPVWSPPANESYNGAVESEYRKPRVMYETKLLVGEGPH